MTLLEEYDKRGISLYMYESGKDEAQSKGDGLKSATIAVKSVT